MKKKRGKGDISIITFLKGGAEGSQQCSSVDNEKKKKKKHDLLASYAPRR